MNSRCRGTLGWLVRMLLLAGAALCQGVVALGQGTPDPWFQQLARESLAQIDGTRSVPGLREPVEVIRDRWGVPHIYAKNTDDLFFAQGYVQAQDRLWQMELWRRYNGGYLAEILGEEAVEHDRLLRLIRTRDPGTTASSISTTLRESGSSRRSQPASMRTSVIAATTCLSSSS